MILRENMFTQIARGGVFPYVSFIFMLLRENRFNEIARVGVFS